MIFWIFWTLFTWFIIWIHHFLLCILPSIIKITITIIYDSNKLPGVITSIHHLTCCYAVVGSPFIHPLTPRLNSTCIFQAVGGSWSTWRKPTQAHGGRHRQDTVRSDRDFNPGPGRLGHIHRAAQTSTIIHRLFWGISPHLTVSQLHVVQLSKYEWTSYRWNTACDFR